MNGKDFVISEQDVNIVMCWRCLVCMRSKLVLLTFKNILLKNVNVCVDCLTCEHNYVLTLSCMYEKEVGAVDLQKYFAQKWCFPTFVLIVSYIAIYQFYILIILSYSLELFGEFLLCFWGILFSTRISSEYAFLLVI